MLTGQFTLFRFREVDQKLLRQWVHTIDFYLIFCNADVLVNDCRLVRCSPSTSTLMGGFNPLLSDVGGLVRVIVNPATPYLLSTLVEFSKSYLQKHYYKAHWLLAEAICSKKNSWRIPIGETWLLLLSVPSISLVSFNFYRVFQGKVSHSKPIFE